MNHGVWQARDLGVYVLGAIEPVQRAWANQHLAACPRCRAGLAGLPAMLRKVPAAEALELSRANTGAAGLPLSQLLGRAARVRRQRRRAAAIAIITTTAAAGVRSFTVTSGGKALVAVAAR